MKRGIVALLLLAWFTNPILFGAISWAPIEKVTDPDVAYHNMAMDSQGNLFTVWLRKEKEGYFIESAYKPHGKKWEKPLRFTKVPGAFSAAQIIVNSLDEVYIVYAERGKDGFSSLKALRRTSFEDWSVPIEIATDNCQYKQLHLATNSRGTVFATWTKRFSQTFYSKGYSIIQTTEKEPNASWSTPSNLTPQGWAEEPQIGADDLGNVYAIWTEEISGYWDGTIRCIQTAERLNGQSWSSPSYIHTNPGLIWGYSFDEGDQPRLIVNPSGEALTIWCKGLGNGNSRIWCSSRNAEKGWSFPEQISLSVWHGRRCDDSYLTVDKQGNAFSIWLQSEASVSGLFSIQASQNIDATGWSPPEKLSEIQLPSMGGLRWNYYYVPPKLYADDLGNIIAVWGRKDKGETTIQAAVYSSDKRCWSEPIDVSEKNDVDKFSPMVFINAFGEVHISWLEETLGEEISTRVLKSRIGSLNQT